MNKQSSHIKSLSLEEREKANVWKILETVCDPEVPVLTITDLGIVKEVVLKTSREQGGAAEVEVIITPTYTGCPAMDMIALNIRLALGEQGYKNSKVTSVLSPAWTTDWMSEAGKNKLKAYGIAPPQQRFAGDREHGIECPQCHSQNTRQLSEFGSTACKALYQCNDCKEPFDYFKCH
jgi:ring-1,2-phenylacetyl-CoA epoxidase subunit PaaD